MDEMREGIGLRAYGQRDPLVEYQHEAFRMFEEMTASIKEEVLERSLKSVLIHQGLRESVFQFSNDNLSHPEFSSEKVFAGRNSDGAPGPARPQRVPSREGTYQRSSEKVGRNDPCPCGSGKKFKKCCG